MGNRGVSRNHARYRLARCWHRDLGKATSFDEMIDVLAAGTRVQSITPQSLGDPSEDLVYTPVNPCRIDTRTSEAYLH
jgi:hypothetical protein